MDHGVRISDEGSDAIGVAKICLNELRGRMIERPNIRSDHIIATIDETLNHPLAEPACRTCDYSHA